MHTNVRYVGLDVHKETIVIAVSDSAGQAVIWKTIAHEHGQVLRELKKLRGQGELRVCYLEILGPAAFAPHTVRFYYREKDKEQFLAETELANDGANLGEHNLEVADLGNGNWQIILKGQEQADERWVVETAGGKVRMKKPEPAS